MNKKKIEEDNKKQKALDAERSEKERIMIENLSREENNLQSLEEKRDMLKKLYNEIVARCESMEKVLKLATGSKDTLPEV